MADIQVETSEKPHADHITRTDFHDSAEAEVRQYTFLAEQDAVYIRNLCPTHDLLVETDQETKEIEPLGEYLFENATKSIKVSAPKLKELETVGFYCRSFKNLAAPIVVAPADPVAEVVEPVAEVVVDPQADSTTV